MDPFDELERMALNAAQASIIDSNVASDDVARWMQIFSYTSEQAADLIAQHYQDLTRNRISDDHWAMIREDLEAQGHDRKSYEHELIIGGLRRRIIKSQSSLTAKQVRTTYLLKLDGPFRSATTVQEAAQLIETPEIVQAEGKDGETRFCIINGVVKRAVLEWLSINAPNFAPTFALLSQKANKALSSHSIYPTIGVESTLPQHRLDNIEDTARLSPAQDQYPVWYFFYGTLAHPDILARQIRVAEDQIALFSATICAGELKTWGIKYRALIDGPSKAQTTGSAFQVMSEEQEDALRAYETDNYEVVRCTISINMNGRSKDVKGCTFRFCGEVDG